MRKIQSRHSFGLLAKGVTIIELMVSLALGVVLVGGITRVYLESKRNYVFDEEVSRMQENGQFALNILRKELAMKGFFSGASSQISRTNVIEGDCQPGWALNALFPMDFINDVGETGQITATANGASFAGCLTAANLQVGSDVISLKRLSSIPTVVDGVYQNGIPAGGEKKKTWYVRLRDYQSTVSGLVYVNNAFNPADLVPASLISMWIYMEKIFFVRNYSVSPAEVPRIPTLMMQSLQDNTLVSATQPAVALVEGVERLHIEFGVPDASVPPRIIYTANPTSAQISAATVARIYLLMRTRNPVAGYTDNKQYKLGSLGPITPVDRNYMRRVFSTTVRFRN